MLREPLLDSTYSTYKRRHGRRIPLAQLGLCERALDAIAGVATAMGAADVAVGFGARQRVERLVRVASVSPSSEPVLAAPRASTH